MKVGAGWDYETCLSILATMQPLVLLCGFTRVSILGIAVCASFAY